MGHEEQLWKLSYGTGIRVEGEDLGRKKGKVMIWLSSFFLYNINNIFTNNPTLIYILNIPS